jgi:hypothetical protein
MLKCTLDPEDSWTIKEFPFRANKDNNSHLFGTAIDTPATEMQLQVLRMDVAEVIETSKTFNVSTESAEETINFGQFECKISL